MYGDQEVLPNELVQLQIVHVAACADLRCMHDDEDVVRIHMDSGNVVTVLAFGDRDRMKLKVIRQDRAASSLHWGMSSQRNPSVRFRTADSSANSGLFTPLESIQRSFMAQSPFTFFSTTTPHDLAKGAGPDEQFTLP
jgi:hypothetical protein